MKRPMRLAGFTLIEMATVIVVSGILAVVVWRNISQPIEGFEDTTRRAQLVDIAESALHRMTSEIRLALPNSIRLKTTGTQTGLEFLRTLTGGRYRAAADPGPGGDNVLSFTAAAGTFDALGGLPNFGTITTGANQSDCLAGPADCLVIFNTGVAGADAYAGDNIAVVTATTASSVSFNISPKTQFPFRSPSQRFYIVDTPVSFVCDTTTSSPINRYDTYPIPASQNVPPVGGSSNELADKATCNITYVAGTATRAGLVTISITVTEPSVTSGGNMQVTILDQVHVLNVP